MTGSELLILLLPAALVIGLLSILSVEHLLLLILFLTPLSLQLSQITGVTGYDPLFPPNRDGDAALHHPVQAYVTHEFPVRLLRHPVTFMIASILRTLVTSLTSSMPGVSFKTLAYRMWFTAAFISSPPSWRAVCGSAACTSLPIRPDWQSW